MEKNLNKTKKFNAKSVIMFMLVLFVIVSPTFAQSADDLGLNSYGSLILDIFTGTWLKALLIVALVVEAILMVVAGQQGGGAQVFKKFAPWLIGTIIILSASSITDYFTSGLEGAFEMKSSFLFIESITNLA